MSFLTKLHSIIPNSGPSFIGVYDDIFNKDVCDYMIGEYESGSHTDGGIIQSGTGLHASHPNQKQCKELSGCDFRDEQIPYQRMLYDGLGIAIRRYKQEYSALDYDLPHWDIVPTFTFKKYETEDDGFKVWHCEHGLGELSHRILVWMVYLNDAESGTQFKYYPNIRAKMGRVVIWPAGWTHVHRSQVPNKGLKYLLSGWYCLNSK